MAAFNDAIRPCLTSERRAQGAWLRGADRELGLARPAAGDLPRSGARRPTLQRLPLARYSSRDWPEPIDGGREPALLQSLELLQLTCIMGRSQILCVATRREAVQTSRRCPRGVAFRSLFYYVYANPQLRAGAERAKYAILSGLQHLQPQHSSTTVIKTAMSTSNGNDADIKAMQAELRELRARVRTLEAEKRRPTLEGHGARVQAIAAEAAALQPLKEAAAATAPASAAALACVEINQ